MQKHQKEREEAAAIKSRAREIVATSARGCGTAKATAMKSCGTANTLGNTKGRMGMRKILSYGIALLAVVVVFGGCKKKEDPVLPGKATLRYETVPYVKSNQKSGELDNLVF